MSDINIFCPHCNSALSVSVELLNTQVLCPLCNREFVSDAKLPELPEPPANVAVPCPFCGEKLQLHESCRGSKTQCPACSNKFVVPQEKSLISPAFSNDSPEIIISEPADEGSKVFKVMIIILAILLLIIIVLGILL